MYIKSIWRELAILVVFYIVWYNCFLYFMVPVILPIGVSCMADVLLAGTYINERLLFTTPLILLFNYMVYHRRQGVNWRIRYGSDLGMLYRCFVIAGTGIVAILLVQIGLLGFWGKIQGKAICNWSLTTSWFCNHYGGTLYISWEKAILILLALHGIFLFAISMVEYVWLIKGGTLWGLALVLYIGGEIEYRFRPIYLLYRSSGFSINMGSELSAWVIPIVSMVLIGGVSVICTKIIKRK